MTPDRRKLPRPSPPLARPSRPLDPQPKSPLPAYARLFEALRPRAMGLAVAIAIAPLGALIGTVSACGGAAPTQPNDRDDAGPDALKPASPSVRDEPMPSGSSSTYVSDAAPIGEGPAVDAGPPQPDDANPPAPPASPSPERREAP